MTESFEKEIASLRRAMDDRIIGRGNKNDDNNPKSSGSLQATVRDLQSRVEERELRLETLLNEANAMRMARDDALCMKDESSSERN
jgi:hypothetical protein